MSRNEGESVEELANRCYTTRWIEGWVDEGRLERAVAAIREANPEFERQNAVRLPRLEGLPYLEHLIEADGELHEVVHRLLKSVEDNRRWLVLSFIDPIRLGCEELGIAVTPEVAESVRARLADAVSFDQELYQQAVEGHDPFEGITLAWRPG